MRKEGRFFLSPLENIEYHQIEPNSVYVWIFTHSLCSEGIFGVRGTSQVTCPKTPEMTRPHHYSLHYSGEHLSGKDLSNGIQEHRRPSIFPPCLEPPHH